LFYSGTVRIALEALPHKIKSPFFQGGHTALEIIGVFHPHLIAGNLGFTETNTGVADKLGLSYTPMTVK
jgi:hypothetical protein